MGDIVHVELPEIGDKFKEETAFGAVESVKTSSELFMPVESEIVDVNKALEDDPSLINQEAEGKGWITKVKVSNPKQIASLLDKAAYDKFLESEAH